MPKVFICVSERVTYSREVEMSDAEWREWDEKTDLRGSAHDDAVERLTARFIRRNEDFMDADQIQLQELSLVLSD